MKATRSLDHAALDAIAALVRRSGREVRDVADGDEDKPASSSE